MGYLTTAFIFNDFLSDIKEDPALGESLYYSCLQQYSSRDIIPIQSKGNPMGYTVSCQHADVTQIVAVGHNTGCLLGNHYGGCGNDEETKLKILKSLADDLGYSLRKRSK